MEHLEAIACSVSELARRYGLPPRVLSDLFYRRILDDQRCPVVGGRRVIPASYVGEIKRVLEERGLLVRAPEGLK